MVQTGVQRAFGSKLRSILGSALRNRFRAFLAGVGIPALLQSSTATGLMTAGFAAGGLVASSYATRGGSSRRTNRPGAMFQLQSAEFGNRLSRLPQVDGYSAAEVDATRKAHRTVRSSSITADIHMRDRPLRNRHRLKYRRSEEGR
jgi:hypothetical protein